MFSACAARDGEEGLDQALAEDNRVQLRLAAFIPCEAVDWIEVYDGDGRSFSWEGGAESSRALLDVLVDPEGEDEVTPRGFPSKKYKKSDVASADGWCGKLKASSVPTQTAYADLSRVFATVSDRPDWEGYAVTRVRMEVHANNPIPIFAPNTDAVVELDIYYAREDGAKKPKFVSYSGSHDRFPNWELYVDKVPVFQYDAQKGGVGPLNLFPIPLRKRRHSGLCTRQDSGPAGAVWSCQAD